MAFAAGYGAAVTVTGSDTALPTAKWKLSKKRAIANVTNSTSGGIKQRKATVKDQQVVLEMPWDDAVNAEASGFAEGSEVKMVLNLGQSSHKYTSTAVLIESIEYENDEDEDVVRAVVTGYANSAFTYS